MKHYLDKNVYEAIQDRLKFIFDNFEFYSKTLDLTHPQLNSLNCYTYLEF